MELSDAALAALNDAAGREDHLVPLRGKVPYISQLNTCRGLERRGLVASVRVKASTLAIVTVANDKGYTGFKLTKAGLAEIGAGDEPETATAPPVSEAPAAPVTEAEQPGAPTDEAATAPRNGGIGLRRATVAFLEMWDAGIPIGDDSLADAVENLRDTMTAPSGISPRAGTKAAQVLAMLGRPGGATNEQMQIAMGWNDNTVRGFLAGLRRKGVKITAGRPAAKIGDVSRSLGKSAMVYRLEVAR